MDIGNQIKNLRQRRGITQEAMAAQLGVTAQAVSKWERGVTTPDIGLLPGISAYFGVTIDELFSLSDDTRMERIQNMLWDERVLSSDDVESAREFLLDKGIREPANGRVYELLADMENHVAQDHHDMAAEYAKEALRRDPQLRDVHSELVFGMNGRIHDWNYNNHHVLIDWYRDYIEQHPDCWIAYMTLMDQLLDDYRVLEAEQYWDRFAKINSTYRVLLYRGKIAWTAGDREKAFQIFAEMERSFPDEWCVWHNIGDHLAWSGRLDEAKRYYRRALDVQKAPRLLDPVEALAQVCEMQGDIPGAIAAWEEELELCDKEWNFTTGESADVIRRQIARLRGK